MYLAPVSGPLGERGGPERGLERPFGQPGRASEHARTAAPFTGATAQKRCRRVGDERGASLAAGARAGAEVFEKPSGDGDDDGDGDDAGRACLSVRVSTSRRPSSALTGPRSAPRESAEGVGPVAGSVGYHRFARAHDGPRPGARAPRSRSPLTPRGRRVTRPPGVSTTILRRPLLREETGAANALAFAGDAAKSGARCGRRGAGSRRAPERRRSIRLSFFLSLSYERERVPSIPLCYTIVYLFASPSQSPLLLRAFVPRAERDLRGTLMILPQVHLRKPCYDFYFL